jgi:hypothetical protein
MGHYHFHVLNEVQSESWGNGKEPENVGAGEKRQDSVSVYDSLGDGCMVDHMSVGRCQ